MTVTAISCDTVPDAIGNGRGNYGMTAVLSSALRWYALYVKSRHEFVTHDELRKKGIDVYLPSVRRLRQWKDRKKSIDFPLFAGYLFVRIAPSAESFLNVLKTRGAVTLLSLVPGTPTPVSEEEINSLRILLESGEQFDIYPNLQEGVRVSIKSGPLKGAVGVVRQKGAHYTVLVNIEILGRSIGVSLCADDIEAQ
jgi:transcription antitermination factor NusG